MPSLGIPKPTSMQIVLGIALAAALAVPAGGQMPATYLNRNLKSRRTPLRVAVMLPPTTGVVTAIHAPVARAEDTEDAVLLAGVLGPYVADALVKAGWQVDRELLSATALATDGARRNLVAFLGERHVQMLREMQSRPKGVTRGEFSLGTAVADLKTQADVLLLLHIETGQWTSTRLGKAAQVLAFPPFPVPSRRDFRKLYITLADAAAGDVLFFTFTSVPEPRPVIREKWLRSYEKILHRQLAKVPHQAAGGNTRP